MRFLFAAVALAVSLAPVTAEARRHREPKVKKEPRVRLYHEGDDIPDGYHVETRPRAGLAGVGAGLFGVPYTVSALAAGLSDDPRVRWLFVPVMGPWILVTTDYGKGGDMSGYGAAFLLLDGIAQAAGLTLLIVGVNTKMTVLARNEVSMQVTPTCSNTGCSLMALGRF